MSGKNPLTVGPKNPLTLSLSKGRHELDLPAHPEPVEV